MGIEPTSPMFSMRLDGFEDRAGHQPKFRFQMELLNRYSSVLALRLSPHFRELQSIFWRWFQRNSLIYRQLRRRFPIVKSRTLRHNRIAGKIVWLTQPVAHQVQP